MSLVDADRLAHRRLDKKGANILPVLLQERHQEVDGKHDVGGQLVFGHRDVADGNTNAENLLELELDRRLLLANLLRQVVRVAQRRRELAGLVETGTEETWDLLDDRLGGEEKVKRLGKLLNLLLVLVHLLQVLDGAKVDAQALCLVAVELVSKNTRTHLWLGSIRQTTSVQMSNVVFLITGYFR